MNAKLFRYPSSAALALAMTLATTATATSVIAAERQAETSAAPAEQLKQAAEEERELLSPLPDTDDGPVVTDESDNAPDLSDGPTAAPETIFLQNIGDTTVPINDVQNGLTGYLLGPGDQLTISVAGVTELDRERIVLPDGTILLPLIGAVPAAGRTLVEFEQDVTRRLSFYIVEPVVEVSLDTLRPVVVTVAGEVNRPGPVQLNSISTFNTTVTANDRLVSENTTPTISTALVSAGGVLRTADLRDITVRRLLPDGREVNLKVNLWETIFQGRGESNVLLQDGDVVFVPEAPEETPGINPQVVARSSLAPETANVRVIGEVPRPGQVVVPNDGTVSSALAIAGGYDLQTADLSQVALLRLQDDGTVEEQIY